MGHEGCREASRDLRVSTADQSTELQARELKQYVASRGWNQVSVYDDSGKTGTNGNRPMLRQPMTDAQERKLDVVVCWKLDRLFRSLRDLIATLQELTELGMDFVSLKDNIDLTTSAGRLMMRLIGAFAEFEASLIRERVRAGLAKGKRLGRPKTRDDGQIALLRARGASIRKIASRLGVSAGSVQRSLKGVAALS